MGASIDVRKFKVALAERGLRQFEVAGRVGIDPTKLSHLLHGRLAASEATRASRRIEEALGLAFGTLAVNDDTES
jgi:transcriptional regulator with XRE-family HTH domain